MTETMVNHEVDSAIVSDLVGGVLTVTLNRPDAANAIRPDDRNALIALFLDADADPEVRVVVLRANGRHFCAGADVVKLADGHAKNVKRVTGAMRTIMTGAQKLVASVLDCGKPVITVVQGAAAGIGAHLAYASDLVIATDAAYFAESFVKRGLVVDGGGAYLLPRRIGMQKAKEMAFFGEKLTAAEALSLGLVNRVVPAADLDDAVADFAGRLAVAPTSAIALTKRLFNDSPDSDRTASFVAEAMAQEIQSYAQDSKEGVTAFVQKRPPEYVGW
ncbi:enoyl-CoA hydratase (plasmid) [Rhodococcus erythropolis]|jgi:2-(1,2-epoxy-1,2-dihydrophenyl)acetyl-CoA isomerase|uniref:enoyl-CoA hydratase/isomerase family protein n=1 Tax=Rhodococcus TaxID=1827 RepID=UPI0005A9DB9D|nr:MULTISPECIES: enoyl-CoA hydratase-related protein [Rhodococcus]MCJ0949797.1 enoyl-CoA hydratase-related protein [Rhodococcus sp. ARC_M8]MDJ0441052.1 enoyl-CoA hydratase-related protein [Rhodococcus qingshengii]MDJ0489965.1 enoyl-CoA hydratase-related protein [Rhodococcus qingshengii]QEX08337.1 enoyl-CoA hydratase [Rhodococcus erythropolis]QOS66415.1 enoyl-CoA hydratase/isomerase family protein [Rhodococcus qingshengii]